MDEERDETVENHVSYVSILVFTSSSTSIFRFHFDIFYGQHSCALSNVNMWILEWDN